MRLAPCTRSPRPGLAESGCSILLVLLATWLLAACVYGSETIECASGVRCPPGTVCVPGHPTCGPAEHVWACDRLPDERFCEVEGLSGHCKQGVCELTPCERTAHCDDGNPCTDDTCNQGRCEREANTAPCNDGNFCNGLDQCQNEVCASAGVSPCAAPTQCEETLQTCVGCMIDEHCPSPVFSDWSSCEADSGVCSLSGTQSREAIYWRCIDDVCEKQPGTETAACSFPDPSGNACDDGDACTELDQCAAGQCQGQQRACEDDNPCTRDGCAPANGCTRTNEPRETLCPGGHCDGAGTCLACPNAGQFCSEGMPLCQGGILRCSESGNHVCEPSGPLPDGTPCGPGLTCTAGECR